MTASRPSTPDPNIEYVSAWGAIPTENGVSGSSSTFPSVSYPRRDDSFYLEPVIFCVGKTLFKVDKKPFMVPGTIFEFMFSRLPAQEGPDGAASVEGESDKTPIHLPGVDETKFKAFLTVLLHPQDIISSDEEYLYRTYINALGLATLWDFKTLREQLIADLTPMIEGRRYVEMIFVAKKHRVSMWLRTAYRMLIRNGSVLPVEELVSSTFKLDWQTIARIYAIRDAIVRQSLDNASCPQCGSNFGPSYGQKHEFKRYSCECRLNQYINAHFGDELDLLKEELLDAEVPTLPTMTATTGTKKKGKKRV